MWGNFKWFLFNIIYFSQGEKNHFPFRGIMAAIRQIFLVSVFTVICFAKLGERKKFGKKKLFDPGILLIFVCRQNPSWPFFSSFSNDSKREMMSVPNAELINKIAFNELKWRLLCYEFVNMVIAIWISYQGSL